MANNCGFGIDIECSIENADKARRVCAIINNEDPEYCVVRTWGAATFDEEEKGDTFAVHIWGDCPWTANYFWAPGDTLAGRDVGDKIDFETGTRMVVSIPFLCQLWDMGATGWEEELGCDVAGEFRCGTDGVLTYRDTLAETYLEYLNNNPWDDCYAQAVHDHYVAGNYDADPELKEQARELLLDPEIRKLWEGEEIDG